jgi:hypothetical protein
MPGYRVPDVFQSLACGVPSNLLATLRLLLSIIAFVNGISARPALAVIGRMLLTPFVQERVVRVNFVTRLLEDGLA